MPEESGARAGRFGGIEDRCQDEVWSLHLGHVPGVLEHLEPRRSDRGGVRVRWAQARAERTISVVTVPNIARADPQSTTFTYSNLSGRGSSHLLTLLARILPGVRKVEGEIPSYAAAWHEHNVAALASTQPLWVVLGDSLSQGVGASSIEQSWVLQAHRQLAAVGLDYRIINLSISGATVTDVLDREIPALDGLAATPAVVTVLIGSNDVIHHSLRASLLTRYRTMLAALPRGAFVGIPARAGGALGEVAALVADEERGGAVHAVQVRVPSSERAEDHFHFNDSGYALFAEDFARAIAEHTTEPG